MGFNSKPVAECPCYIARLWKQGSATVFPVHKLILKLLGVAPRQKVLIRVHPAYVTFRVVHPDEVIPVGAFTMGELPPVWPKHPHPTRGESPAQ